jgi:two-component system, OmpR family, sensor histidine kinase VanS
MPRRPGLSARLKLTLSYAGFLIVAVALLLAVIWGFLLRYLPESGTVGDRGYVPGRRDLEDAFAPALIWVLLFLLVVGLVGGWFLSGRMLAPLKRITDTTRKVTSGHLSSRVEMPGRRDEFRELADGFDAMLARLEAHVAEQQRFAANASHELRTPLAITQALIDTARRDPERDIDKLMERLHAANSRAIDLTEALLVLSRADHGSFVKQAVDLSLAAEQAVETLLPLAERNSIDIDIDGDIVMVDGSQALLQQMVTNLIHNAIVHNCTGPGTVWVSTRTPSTGAILTVENTGAQIDPAIVATFTEPFQRGTARVHREQVGSGLGLAIVKSIVTAHGGAVELVTREGGGLRVIVTLPTLG